MIDCDEATLLVALRDERQLEEAEVETLSAHAACCEPCATLADDESASAADRSHGVTGSAGRNGLPFVDPGSYAWEKTIGRGGMGRVSMAFDRRLGRTVAIKELLAEQLAGRFEREATITARLQHPAIVPVYEAGLWPNGEPFYAMKMVGGDAFDKVISRASSLAERVALLPKIVTVAEALAYAHDRRIIHRDLKPANVLIGEYGETLVIDWGLAKELEGDPSEPSDTTPYRRGDGMTMAGETVGTPAYMSPEQARGADVDERTDAYAIGAMLYHLLAGRAPYADTGVRGESLVELVVSEPPTPLASLCSDVPADLVAIVDKAMAREPDERYPSAAELRDDLVKFQTGQLVGARDYSLFEVLRRWVRRHRSFVLATMAVVVVGVIAATLSVRRIIVERERAERSERQARHSEQRARQQSMRVRDMARMAVADRLAESEPAAAVLALRDVEDPVGARAWVKTAQRALDGGVAQRKLRGHTGDVRAAVFSPNGRLVVTASDDHTARVWRADENGEPMVLRGHAASIRRAVFSPDSTRVATASADSTARVWQVDGGADPLVLRGHLDAVRAVAFSADGNRVVTASADGTARVWRTDGRGAPMVLRGHAQSVNTATFNADGTRVLTASSDHTARIWAADGSGEVVVLRGHQGEVQTAVFSPDGARVLTASSDGTARVWSAEEHVEPVVLRGHEGELWSAAFSPDGARIVTASSDGTVRVWSADGRSEPVVLRAPGSLWAATFSPDGTLVAASCPEDSTALVWNATGGGAPLVLRHSKNSIVWSATFSPDGARVVTASSDRSARLWSATGPGEPAVRLRHENDVYTAVFSPDGTRVATASGDGTARVWQADGRGQPVVFRGHTRPVLKARFSADGRRLVTASEDGTARVWGADGAGEPLVLQGHESGLLDAAFSPNGELIVTASWDKTARVWRAGGGDVQAVLRGHEGAVHAASFSPDGGRVLTVAKDKTARVWSVGGGKPPVVLRGHQGDINTAVFSPDGARVLTASADGTARVWHADGTGEPVVLRGHAEAVLAATFSPDGGRVATGSDDGTARVWNADGRGDAIVLRGHPQSVGSVQFSPDGTRIVAGLFLDSWIWTADGSGEPLVLSWTDEPRPTYNGIVLVNSSASFSADGSRVVARNYGLARVWMLDPKQIAARLWRVVPDCLRVSERRSLFADDEQDARAAHGRCRARVSGARRAAP